MAGPFDDLPDEGAPANGGGPVYGPPAKADKPPSGYIGDSSGYKPIPGGPADPTRPGGELDPNKPSTDAKDTADEKVSAGYYSRAIRAHQGYGSGIGSRDVASQVGINMIPGTFQPIVDANTGKRRRGAESFADEFIRAKLRKESGAAIPPDEMAREYRTYFPITGDGPNDIKRKAQLRAQTIEGLKVAAGSSAADVEILPVTDLDGKAYNFDRKSGQFVKDGKAEGPLSLQDFRSQMKALIADKSKSPEQRLQEAMALTDLAQRKVDPAQVEDAIKAGGGNVVEDPDFVPPDDFNLGDGMYASIGDMAEGAGDLLGIAANPINAAANWGLGTNISTDMGQTFRDATGAPDGHPVASAITKGIVGGGGMSAVARRAANYAAPVVAQSLKSFAAMPVRDAIAGGSGAASAEAVNQAGGGPLAQTVAGLAGGGASLPITGRLGQMMNPRTAAEMPSVVRAGQTEGVPVNRAMADPNVQNRVTGAEATMAGGPIIRRDMNTIGDMIEGRVQSLGGGGSALDADVGGQTVQRVSDRYIKDSGAKFGRRYDNLEKATAGVKMPPSQSLGVVDGVIAKLSETPATNAEEIKFLQNMRSDFESDLSVGALRRVRTSLRKRISKGELAFGEDEATVLSIMDAASEDITTGLKAAGRGAAAAEFRKVDGDYRQRMEFIKGTLQKLVGKRGANLSPQRIFANLQSMAAPKGDSAGLVRMLKTMEPDEAADIGATFADALGKNNKGEFSTTLLLSQARRLPKAARVALFGEAGDASLTNLLVLAKEHSRVAGGLNNSRTGVANDYRSWLGNLMFGGGTALFTESGVAGIGVTVAGIGAKTGRDVLTARSLMSKDLTGWLRSAPKTTNPQKINEHFARLASIAARNPGLSAEIETVSQAIIRAANDNIGVGRSAASPDAQAENDHQ